MYKRNKQFNIKMMVPIRKKSLVFKVNHYNFKRFVFTELYKKKYDLNKKTLRLPLLMQPIQQFNKNLSERQYNAVLS